MKQINYFIAVLIIAVSCFVIAVSLSFTTISTDFCDGWEDGYCEGWKDVKGQFSICPITPICPLANTNCNSGYKCGYNRGFKAGTKAARK